jgi:hypothetical protein
MGRARGADGHPSSTTADGRVGGGAGRSRGLPCLARCCCPGPRPGGPGAWDRAGWAARCSAPHGQACGWYWLEALLWVVTFEHDAEAPEIQEAMAIGAPLQGAGSAGWVAWAEPRRRVLCVREFCRLLADFRAARTVSGERLRVRMALVFALWCEGYFQVSAFSDEPIAVTERGAAVDLQLDVRGQHWMMVRGADPSLWRRCPRRGLRWSGLGSGVRRESE